MRPKMFLLSCVMGFVAMNAFANDDDLFTVDLYPRHVTGTMPGSHKAPRTMSCPLLLQYDISSNSFVFYAESIDECTLSLFDENEILLSQETLEFVEDSTISISLSGLEESYYLIQLEIGGVIYEGVLDLR